MSTTTTTTSNIDVSLASEYKYNQFMPPFVKETISQEAIEWKEQFFTGFKNALIDEDNVDWTCAMSSVRIFHRYVCGC